MPVFNLIDEPWIPCVTLNGEPREMSLRDALTSAHKVRELFDSSPLVTAAMHRLLLAILHRNFGPPDFDSWKQLWRQGRWDAEKLNEYFTEWHHRFYLFDDERPFYQVQRLQKASKKSNVDGASNSENATLHPIALLMQEAAAGNNATLFDHSFSANPVAVSPAHAARYLVTRQSYSVGFGVSQPFNLSDSTLIRGYSVLVKGENLFETLTLNLIVYNDQSPMPIPSRGRDLPEWEHEQPAQPDRDGTPVRGYVEYLTWQSRRIHLVSEPEVSGVRYCHLLQNLKLPSPPPLDPFKCYVVDKERGMKARRIDPAKALWRDSHALFQQVDDSIKRPEIFNQLARVEKARRAGEINARPSYSFTVYGLATEIGKAASVILWSRELLPLPLVYLEDRVLVAALNKALDLADQVSNAVATGARALARLLLSPNARQPDEEKDIKPLARSFGVKEAYWSQLETHFKQLLIDLPSDRTEEYGEVVYGDRELPRWAETLHRTAMSAFTLATRSLDNSSRALKAVAKAEPPFRAKLRGVLGDYFKQAAANGR